jgi:predicted GIY-YIG superfamily endonuclease
MMKQTYVYFIQQGSGSIKIGVSDDPETRCATLQTATSRYLRIIAKFPFKSRSEAFSVEKELHQRFEKYRSRGEWFRPRILRVMRIGGKRLITGTNKNPNMRKKETEQ